MTAQHTPGPWAASETTNAHGRYPIDPTIGCAYGEHAEAKANANLMAAAPDMLEALERVQECLKKHKQYAHMGNGYLEEADEIAAQAIAKAKAECGAR